MMWVQGGYFYDALGAVIASAFGGKRGAIYMEEPMMLAHEIEEKKERDRQKLLAFFEEMKKSHKKPKEGG